jgi:hypothetical protein
MTASVVVDACIVTRQDQVGQRQIIKSQRILLTLAWLPCQFKVAEEVFNRPAVVVAQRHQFGVVVDAIDAQEQDFGLARGVGLAGGDGDDANWLLQDGAAVPAAWGLRQVYGLPWH